MKPKFKVGQWVWFFRPLHSDWCSVMGVYAQILSITIGSDTIIYEIDEIDETDEMENWQTKVLEALIFGSDSEMLEETKVRRKLLKELIEKKDDVPELTFFGTEDEARKYYDFYGTS